MFRVLTQTNTLTSYEYWPGVGHVLTVQKWGRILTCVLGMWYEVILPRTCPFTAYEKHIYIFRPFGYLRAQSQTEIDADAELKARIEAEEMREEAGWIEGNTYEEEKEPDFWASMKQRKTETDEVENYVIARYDFH